MTTCMPELIAYAEHDAELTHFLYRRTREFELERRVQDRRVQLRRALWLVIGTSALKTVAFVWWVICWAFGIGNVELVHVAQLSVLILKVEVPWLLLLAFCWWRHRRAVREALAFAKEPLHGH